MFDFLERNEVPAHGNPEIEQQLYHAMIAIATHELDKPGFAALLREIFH